MSFSKLIQEYISLRQRASRGQLEQKEQAREKDLQQGLMLAQIDIPAELEQQEKGFVRIQDGEQIMDWPLLLNDKGLLNLNLQQPWNANEERVALLSRGPNKNIEVVRCRVVELVQEQPLRVWVQLEETNFAQAANDSVNTQP